MFKINFYFSIEENIESRSYPNLCLSGEGESNINPDFKEYFDESQFESNKKYNDDITINEAVSESLNIDNEEKRKLEKSQNAEIEIESALLELIVKLSNKNLLYDMDLSEETLNTISKFKSD